MKRNEVNFILDLAYEHCKLSTALDLLKYKMKNDLDGTNRTKAILNQDELNEVLFVAGYLDTEIDCPCDHFKEDCEDVHE